MKPFVLIGVLSFSASLATAEILKTPIPMVVTATVVDVRAATEPRKMEIAYDPLQETQVERGDPVLVFERQGKWSRIEAPDQPEYTHNDRWQGYPGWILSSALGTDLKKILILKPVAGGQDVRQQFVNQAARHLDEPYVWGGRSLRNPKIKDVVTGVDCSGLVNWAFRQVGFRVPRDAHEQYMKSRPVEPKELKPGDLFFLAKTEQRDRIVHVGIYVGGNQLIEAPQTGDLVHRMAFKERFGKTLADLHQGEVLGDRVIYFGTLFPEGQ